MLSYVLTVSRVKFRVRRIHQNARVSDTTTNSTAIFPRSRLETMVAANSL